MYDVYHVYFNTSEVTQNNSYSSDIVFHAAGMEQQSAKFSRLPEDCCCIGIICIILLENNSDKVPLFASCREYSSFACSCWGRRWRTC